MSETQTLTETHSCIVCGRSFQLYVVRDQQGKFIHAKILNLEARLLADMPRPLPICNQHTEDQLKTAMARQVKIYDNEPEDDEE